MNWRELKKAVEETLAAHNLTDDVEVKLDMEPDQAVRNWGISTKLDGTKSLLLTSQEYDETKCYWLMTCIRCDRASLVYGTRTVCYECDPVLYPRPEDTKG